MRFHLKLANSVYARMFFVLCIVAVPTVIGLCVYAYYERNQNLADSRATAQHYVNMVARHESWLKIGRASCRERVCQYGVDLGGRRIIKKQKKTRNRQYTNNKRENKEK